MFMITVEDSVWVSPKRLEVKILNFSNDRNLKKFMKFLFFRVW